MFSKEVHPKHALQDLEADDDETSESQRADEDRHSRSDDVSDARERCSPLRAPPSRPNVDEEGVYSRSVWSNEMDDVEKNARSFKLEGDHEEQGTQIIRNNSFQDLEAGPAFVNDNCIVDPALDFQGGNGRAISEGSTSKYGTQSPKVDGREWRSPSSHAESIDHRPKSQVQSPKLNGSDRNSPGIDNRPRSQQRDEELQRIPLSAWRSSSSSSESDNVEQDQGVFIPGVPPDVPPELSRVRKCFRSTGKFLRDYHMPLLLLLGLVLGILVPLPGKTLGDVRLNQGLCLASSNITANGMVCVWSTLSSLCVTFIFIISGLNLDLNKTKRALRAKKEIAMGMALIFLVTSSFGFAIAAAPRMNPPEFSFGLSLFSLMPTTMSSCVIIVGYAGGNVALALLLTIASNVLAVAILPVTVTWLVDVYSARSSSNAGHAQARLDAVQLCLNLVFQVLVPLVCAVSFKRMFKARVQKWVKSHAMLLKATSATLNAAIPWMRISQNSQNFMKTSPGAYFVILLCAMALHLLYLALSALCSMKLVKMQSLEEVKAVTFIGAQKTLPIALSVLELLPTAVTGDQGLVLVPMVFVYLFQAIFDSVVAVKWSRRVVPVT